MPEGEDKDGVFGRVVAIQGDIARIPKRHGQLAEFRRFGEWPPHFRLGFQKVELLDDGLGGPPGRVGALFR